MYDRMTIEVTYSVGVGGCVVQHSINSRYSAKINVKPHRTHHSIDAFHCARFTAARSQHTFDLDPSVSTGNKPLSPQFVRLVHH